MSMNNKQRWLGGVVVLSGGVLLAALLLKGQGEIKENAIQKPAVAAVQAQKAATAEEIVQLQPLTVDVATEKRLLDEQRRAREKAVAEQEARAAEFLAMQQRAEADAARKAAEEYAAINAHRSQQSSDNIPPELIEEAKTNKVAAQRLAEEQKKQEQKQQTTQQQRDAEKKRLADEKRKEEQAKATAEKKAADEKKRIENERKALEQKKQEDAARKQKEAERKAAEEKAKASEERKQKEAERKAVEERKQKEAERKAAEEKKRKADEAKKKAEADKARQLLEKGDKQWMVQVALAANEESAEAMASKLRAKGYKVTKSKTSKGVRIMVGPAKDREAADASRKRITKDASLGMNSAWIIEWVPLDKR